jgi:hypothetical protein
MSFTNARYALLTDAAETGDAVEWSGGRGAFSVYSGTFGGATVTLQWSPDDGSTWLAVDASGDTFTTKTAAGSGNFELPPCLVRAAVTGGTPSGLNASVHGIG